MNNTKSKATFESIADVSRFFVDVKADDGSDKKKMIVLRKACVVVSIPLKNGSTDKVAFMKTNRGENYRDSRGRKVTKTKDDGEVETVIRPLMISESEVKSELIRLLDPQSAVDAFKALQV